MSALTLAEREQPRSSTKFYAVARRWMQLAREEKRRGRHALATTLAHSAREYVRTGRVWQYVFEAPPLEPWPEAMLATVRRISPYRPPLFFRGLR